MIEQYFTFKMIGLYVCLFINAILLFGLIFVNCWYRYHLRRERKVRAFMTSMGYDRRWIRSKTYAFVHRESGVSVEEDELDKMSFRQIKRKYGSSNK